MREAQGHVMEVMKELANVEAQLNLCKKRLEISDTFEELDCQYRLVNPVPIHPCHSSVRSPLVEASRVVRAMVHFHLVLGDQSRCLSSMTRTHTVVLPDAIGARGKGMSYPSAMQRRGTRSVPFVEAPTNLPSAPLRLVLCYGTACERLLYGYD